MDDVLHLKFHRAFIPVFAHSISYKEHYMFIKKLIPQTAHNIWNKECYVR
jgi:hypothetical protein